MARIRSIKEDVFHDDTLSDVSIEAHFLLVALPVWADSAGRLEDRPRKISARVFPYRPSIDVDACLTELADSGHVVRYEADGERYLQIVDWESNQRPHVKEAESIIPPPAQKNTEPRRVPGESPASPPPSPQGLGIMDSGSGIRDSGFSADEIRRTGKAISEQGNLIPPPTPPAKPEKQKRKRKADTESSDPRHHPLKLALVAAGWPFDGGRDADNLKALLAIADQQEATAGSSAQAEILRRAAIAWGQFPGYHSARTLGGLRSKWGEFAAPVGPDGKPKDYTRGVARAEDFKHDEGPGEVAW